MLFRISAIRLLRDEPMYRRLFVAGLLTGIGDRFCQVAMLALIIRTTGSGLALGGALALRVLPFLLLAPIGGLLTKYFSRRNIMLTINCIRAPLALGYLLVHQAEDLWILYVVTALLACAEAVYAPVRKSGIPLFVRSENLLRVNALEQVLNGVVLIVGALLGGIVSTVFGPQSAFVANAAAFMLAAGLVRRLDDSSGSKPYEGGGLEDTNVRKRNGSASAIWPLIRVSIPLQVIIGFELLVPVINGIDNVLISVYAIQVFGLGDWGVGMFYSSLGLGLVLSSLCSRYVRGRLLAGVVICLLIEGSLLMVLSRAPGPISAVIIYLSLAFMSGIGNTCLDTLLMIKVPEKHRGVIYGVVTAWSGSVLGLSMFGAGILLERMDPRQLGFVGGLGFAVLALFLSVYAWIRDRRVFGRNGA